MAPDCKIERHDCVRGLERQIDFTVRLSDDHRLGGQAFIKLARIAVGAQHRRQFVKLYNDGFGRVLRPIGIVRKHDRDWIADIAHAAACQHWLPIRNKRFHAVVAKIDWGQGAEIVAGPGGHNARIRPGRRRIDRNDPPVRNRGADNAHVELKRKRNIGREQPASLYQRAIL